MTPEPTEIFALGPDTTALALISPNGQCVENIGASRPSSGRPLISGRINGARTSRLLEQW